MTDTASTPPVHTHSPSPFNGMGAVAMKKYGPLAVWEYAAIGVAIYLVYRWRSTGSLFAKVSSDSDTSTPTTASNTPTTASSSDSDSGDVGRPVIPSDPVSSTGQQPVTTDAEWGSRAVSFLIGQGITAQVASNAVAHYLAGSAMTTTEQQAIAKAIGSLGPPPSGAKALVNAPTAAPAPGYAVPLTPVRSYKVPKDGMTTHEIVAAEYGTNISNTANMWNVLRVLQVNGISTNYVGLGIKKGRVLQIPAYEPPPPDWRY